MNKIIGLVVAVAALSGCGTDPEQFLINFDKQYSVSPGVSAKCAASEPTERATATTLKDNLIVSIYPGNDGKFYADFGSRVVAGTKAGDIYTLTDSQTKNDDSGFANDVNRRTSDVVSVSLTVDGDFVTGTWQETIHEECNGDGCRIGGNLPPVIECVYKTNFRGRSLGYDRTVASLPQPGR